MHHGEHHHGGSEVIEIDGNQECNDGECPQHLLAAACAKQLAHEVEAAVVVEDFYDRNRSEQEHHDLRCPTHLWKEDVSGDEVLDRSTG